MTAFTFSLPGRVIFGRGSAAATAGLIRPFGPRGLVVHGRTPDRAAPLLAEIGDDVLAISCPTEPTLPLLEGALALARNAVPDWIVAIGGGSVIDLGKALAALIPASGSPMDHLEVVGRGLPLTVPPLPVIALPTTAGTGAEATRNAVIGLPEHGRKVSLRDDRMLPRIAIVDPALTDHCPRGVTLASGMDALTQVIEPFVSCKATPFTDSLTEPQIGKGLWALRRLMLAEDPLARDAMAYVSLTGGIALANAGLGAVHGLAGVIGGLYPAAHGAICGTLLGPVLAMNARRSSGEAGQRIARVCRVIADELGSTEAEAPFALSRWAHGAGLPDLAGQGVPASAHDRIAEASLESSSMRGNPVALSMADLRDILSQG